jgi:hypothetical protein
MNRKTITLLNLILVLILSGCVPRAAEPAVYNYPTPTVSPNFNNRQNSTGAREVSGLFSGSQQPTPPVSAEISQPATARPAAAAVEKVSHLPVYMDEVHPSWIIQRTKGSEINAFSRELVYEGASSLEYSPGEGASLLYFVVKENSAEAYPLEKVVGLTFWLNSGAEGLNNDELAVTVLGSNDYPYWVPNDRSVTSHLDPVFSETRLYYLGVDRPIPPNSWAKVELWMDERIYDPDYTFVTGFYIKVAESLRHTIYLDDIQLVLREPESDQEATSEAESRLFPEAARGEEFMPVWTVTVDTQQDVHPISPFIYGVSVADVDFLDAVMPTLNSWGGNPSTRYNWELGNAWNAGRDYFFKNGNYGITEGSASDGFIENAMERGIAVRLAVPTLGWVAKNDDLDTCSFPTEDGECSDVPLATCERPTKIADPTLANVRSTSESIGKWMEHLFNDQEYDVRFVAMDNEPELWGYTHYDVHPDCTTYQEILDKNIEYATVVREVAPEAEITGPVTCCWYYYWNSAAGVMDKILNGNQHFLPWFLENVKKHDEKNKIQTIDVLDIHYYQEGVYNQNTDEETAALRLRSTRSLWDPNYVDASWINEPIYLIPRMKALIDEHYPGLKLAITEWNWGADQHMNGALAIADVLGIFGREDIYMAAYWTHPPVDYPGAFAFQMYTNYDGRGSRFGDISVRTVSADSDVIASYAALDSKTGALHLMLINKIPDKNLPVQISLNGFSPGKNGQRYFYSEDRALEIRRSVFEVTPESLNMELPAYSITLLVLEPLARSTVK